MNGELPDSPLLVVGQPETADTNRTPEGKYTLWIQVRALPSTVKKDSLGEILPANWDHLKEAIRERVVFSPIDLERDNTNLQGGDSVSGSHHLFQFYLFRPIAGYSRYQTPIKNLYQVGAATWPGGGLNATSGMLLGNKLK